MATETPTTVDVETQLQLLEAMLRIRAFENAANQLYLSAKMPGLTHLYITTLAIDPHTPVRLYAGTVEGGVFVMELE